MNIHKLNTSMKTEPRRNRIPLYGPFQSLLLKEKSLSCFFKLYHNVYIYSLHLASSAQQYGCEIQPYWLWIVVHSSFSLLYSIPLCEYNTRYSSIVGYLGSFKFLASMNNVAIKIWAHVFWWTYTHISVGIVHQKVCMC